VARRKPRTLVSAFSCNSARALRALRRGPLTQLRL